jgi:hypothetical protein
MTRGISWLVWAFAAAAVGCGAVRHDAAADAAGPGDTGGSMPVCTAKQALRCDGDNLVRCDDDGGAELTVRCALGCNGTELRCNDIDPSTGTVGVR